ncbi:M1 family metallopeptidase [Flavobacterium sp.]|uniref:M1 family metallopeptidase n=1 Tax=Flavobacterium sp. TaxID=239 RepID=UPI00261758E0|nr:M1 family metallopeptidase [Flavobacterium sp.]MDD3004124.1 M1 family metallopeptidase [Flavobacterium sp.]
MKLSFYLLLVFSVSLSAQNVPKVDFVSAISELRINSDQKSIAGKVTYIFEVKSAMDTIKIDAINMDFQNIKINNKKVNFKNSGKELQLFEGYKKGKNKLTFDYAATPKQTLYFVSEGDGKQIWTQGQGKYTSHWLPSFDDENEKVIFNTSITFHKDFQVISNGVLAQKSVKDSMATWSYKMPHPMSSYLVMLAIGKYEKKTDFTQSGTSLEFYVAPEDTRKFEPTYRYSKQIFDFFEKEIGVKYPWKIYRQIPVKDFLYAGMENTTSTLFAQDFVVDSIGFNDRTYVNVNAHELAHQWFGDMVTAKAGQHHWLQEGFATYYALLAEKDIFGEDYFNWELYEIAERLIAASKSDTIPILNSKASSLTFYQKGAWALHYLQDKIGYKVFQQAVKNYLLKYQFKNVDTDEFLAEIDKISDFDTQKFKRDWLESAVFQTEDVLAILNKSPFIRAYFEVSELKEMTFEQKKLTYTHLLKGNGFYPLKEEIIYQLQSIPYEEKKEILRLAMQSGDFKTRQAIAKTLKTIPEDFKSEYLTLFEDSSYITREIALNKYWSEFPEERILVLEKSKNWVGLNDKNLRVLWLTLALATPNYELENKPHYYDELLDYAKPVYESNLRQNAISKLLFLDKNDQNTLKYLVNALVSHRWQFVKFARENVRNLLKSEIHRKFFQDMLEQLPEAEKNQLNRLLQEKK